MQTISGFSKLSKEEKINYLISEFSGPFGEGDQSTKLLKSFWHPNRQEQQIFDEFSENTVSNFYSPYGVVPNFLLNDQIYCLPMVTEESSVVAAAASSAKFWLKRGGLKAQVLNVEKVGQVHFCWPGDSSVLQNIFNDFLHDFLQEAAPLTENMEKRGGGLKSIVLKNKTSELADYYQLYCTFDTCDAMGANFINSILELLGSSFKSRVEAEISTQKLQLIMCILSNYTPHCRVKASVSCPIKSLQDKSFKMEGIEFARKFERGIKISKIDVHRAVTHNKGIFNGIDALVSATGNDFRAVEACGHSYAARDGQYRGLSDISLDNDIFKFSLELPLALGTVGGLTSLHPLAKFSLQLLGRPSASKLMELAASLGLAQNFAAMKSLITSGIQKGHMKMHLLNILNHLQGSESEKLKAQEFFKDRGISFNEVAEFLKGLRNYQ